MTGMFDKIPDLGGEGLALRKGMKHVLEDLSLVRKGVLNPKGFVSGYLPVKNPVEMCVFDGPKIKALGGKLVFDEADETGPRAHWEHRGQRINLNDAHWKRAIKTISRSHNLRVTMGRDQWQRLLMFGNITANATGYTGVSGTATATSATSLTNTGAAFPTTGGPNTGLQGQVVVCPVAGVFGTITSNTATVLTVDQWTSLTSATGAAGTTPGGTAVYAVTPWAGGSALWVGLSTNSAAAAAGDVLRTADGLFADGTTGATATEQNANGLVRTYVPPTFPSAGNIQLAVTFTYTGSTSVAITKAVLCNSKPVVGSLLILETLTNATATVNTSGDSIALQWSIGL